MTQARHAHHIEITPATSRVRITRDGVVLAESDRALVLKEGSLPLRYYVPRDDVRMELLTPTDHASHCPFKGDAKYWSAAGVDNIVWSYEEPFDGVAEIAGHLAFYNDKVGIQFD